eukprot:2029203-Amphidinium_carterae.4
MPRDLRTDRDVELIPRNTRTRLAQLASRSTDNRSTRQNNPDSQSGHNERKKFTQVQHQNLSYNRHRDFWQKIPETRTETREPVPIQPESIHQKRNNRN